MTTDLFADLLERDRAVESSQRGRAPIDSRTEGSGGTQGAPLARRTDPTTSHAAAASARRFVPTHSDLILGVLWRPLIASEISRFTGLTVVQVDRRMPELQAAGRARLTGAERDGFREWEKVLNV